MENSLELATPIGVAMPVLTVEQAVARYSEVRALVASTLLKSDVDYGVIPGTKGRMTLLKPGAEKLCMFFGLLPDIVAVAETEDWSGAAHGGEAFFYYRYKCTLSRSGVVIASGEGSCNSWESKYRYRNAPRKCPNCGAEAIIAEKAEFVKRGEVPGWLCFYKKGGCGTKFTADHPELGKPGKMLNPDPADVVNTVQKMAQKRAFISAVLMACGVSEFFTQDMEDAERDTPDQPAAKSVWSNAPQAPKAPTAPPPAKAQTSPAGAASGSKAKAKPAPRAVDAQELPLEAPPPETERPSAAAEPQGSKIHPSYAGPRVAGRAMTRQEDKAAHYEGVDVKECHWVQDGKSPSGHAWSMYSATLVDQTTGDVVELPTFDSAVADVLTAAANMGALVTLDTANPKGKEKITRVALEG